MIKNSQVNQLIQFLDNTLTNIFSINIEGQNQREILENPIFFHYAQEIIRYYSTINYIFKKLIRRHKSEEKPVRLKESLFFYCIYRKFWENAKINQIWNYISSSLDSSNEKSYISYFLNLLQKFNLDKSIKNKSYEERLSITEAIPSFMINKLKPHLSAKELLENLSAMNSLGRRGNLYFWIIKKQKTSESRNKQVSRILKTLSDNKIIVKQDKDIQGLFSINASQKGALLNSSPYIQKEIFIQQKPSIATIYTLNPTVSDCVLDICAAPGAKTAYAYSFQHRFQHKFHILANDFHRERLMQIPSLFSTYFEDEKNSTSRLNLLHSDGKHPPFRKIFNKVLIDAPCTGSGTFSSDPNLKWRQNHKFLKRNVWIQQNMLQQIGNCIQSGGMLIYSTCSLYYEENEGHFTNPRIFDIIKENFEPDILPKFISPSYLPENHPFSRATGRFYPAQHGTIGFFIAKLKRK